MVLLHMAGWFCILAAGLQGWDRTNLTLVRQKATEVQTNGLRAPSATASCSWLLVPHTSRGLFERICVAGWLFEHALFHALLCPYMYPYLPACRALSCLQW